MSEMVERVARAIADHFTNGNEQYDDLSEYERITYVASARAAIEAIIPFVSDMPPARLIGTSDTDPGRIWSIAAEAQLGAVVGHLQAALKEQE
jgi:hypothetical protein